MACLIDTGILLRGFDTEDTQFPVIQAAIASLQDDGEVLYTTAQNVAEFVNVTTRPLAARGGFGKSNEVAMKRVAFIVAMCRLLTESTRSFDEWRALVGGLEIQGVSVHDARIAAIMRVHQIPRILTLDRSGFNRYPDVVALSPADIVK